MTKNTRAGSLYKSSCLQIESEVQHILTIAGKNILYTPTFSCKGYVKLTYASFSHHNCMKGLISNWLSMNFDLNKNQQELPTHQGVEQPMVCLQFPPIYFNLLEYWNDKIFTLLWLKATCDLHEQ